MAVKKSQIEQLQDMYQRLISARDPYLKIWRQVSEWIDPWYGRMDMGSAPSANDLPLSSAIYDSTVSYYSQVFTTGLQGYTCSSQSAFFGIVPEDPKTMEKNSELTEMLQARSRAMYQVFKSSKLYKTLHPFLKSFGDLGTAIMVMGKHPDTLKPYYNYVPNYQCLTIKDNFHGDVDTLFRTLWLTAYDARKQFGEDNLPPCVLKCTDKMKQFKFIQVFAPRGRFDLDIEADTPFVEVVWCAEDVKKAVFEGGTKFRRFICTPWAESFDGTAWGIGAPGMRQFTSSHSMQLMMRDQMNASRYMSAPPLKKTENLIADIKPGGFINIPPGGDIAALQMGADVSWNNMTRQDLRAQAKADYFVDFFLMLSQYSGQVNTATLAQGLQNEQIKMMTYFLDVLSNSLFEPLIEWTWNAMGEDGMFNDGYSIAYDDLNIDYISPLYRIQRQAVSLEPTVNAMNLILPYMQLDNSLMAYVDLPEYAKIVRDATGADVRVIRSDDKAKQILETQARAAKDAEETALSIEKQKADAATYNAESKAPEEGSPAQMQAGDRYKNLKFGGING